MLQIYCAAGVSRNSIPNKSENASYSSFLFRAKSKKKFALACHFFIWAQILTHIESEKEWARFYVGPTVCV